MLSIVNWSKSNKNVCTEQKISVLSLVNKRKDYVLSLPDFICEKFYGEVIQSENGIMYNIVHLNANKIKTRRRTDRINKKLVDFFAKERIAC